MIRTRRLGAIIGAGRLARQGGTPWSKVLLGNQRLSRGMLAGGQSSVFGLRSLVQNHSPESGDGRARAIAREGGRVFSAVQIPPSLSFHCLAPATRKSPRPPSKSAPAPEPATQFHPPSSPSPLSPMAPKPKQNKRQDDDGWQPIVGNEVHQRRGLLMNSISSLENFLSKKQLIWSQDR